ncbi:MAG: TonB-dependent receptor [Thermoanaerobaculales bacterium]|jgi:iron complex outermembrane receptor protein|nr:TonB-dependent receptor [Thermoanaerobaculales bacterium]
MRHLEIALCFAVAVAACPVMATVEGTVVTPGNLPVEGARVELADGSAFRLTDAHGHFSFTELSPPVGLRIVHPRFQPLEVECCDDPAPIIVLVPKQEVFGEIVVTASREGSASLQPVSVATSTITADDRPAPVVSLVDLVEGTPGVAQSGQGGLFQAYSIRGTGGQRVLSLVAGTRIIAERRAGAAASFVDPLLLGSVNVVRGPYSSYYGSGAIGGVIEAVPRRFDGITVEAGWESQGDANYQLLALAPGGWSLGLARRASRATETPEGDELPSQFEQVSATVGRGWSLDNGLELDLQLVPSYGEDIGKPNTRYPSRITTYPEEQHLVARFVVRRPGAWHLDVYGHPNTLDTENLRSTSHSLVENRSFDLGLNHQREIALPEGFAARVGLDYFGRHGVEATETVDDLVAGTAESFTTLDGRQDEVGAYASVRRSFGALSAELGGRFTWIEQANAGAATTDDTAATGFLGLSAPVGGGFELVGNIGTGFRFPGLSERFFSGSTGRGEIVANQDLEPERSLTTDIGVRFFGSRFYAAVYAYRSSIDDYIEQVEAEPGVQTFVNLTSGTIEGFELESFYQVTDELRLELMGQTTDAEADDGAPLAEAPPDQLTLGARFAKRGWGAALRWQHRFAKDDPGPGEVSTDSADVVSASVSHVLPAGLELVVFGDNLLDETYLPTADELAVPAAGRSIGLGLRWRG